MWWLMNLKLSWNWIKAGRVKLQETSIYFFIQHISYFFIFSSTWFPKESFTPLATHTHMQFSTTVAQSDTVSLCDNRHLFKKRRKRMEGKENNDICALKLPFYQATTDRPHAMFPLSVPYVLKLGKTLWYFLVVIVHSFNGAGEI